MSHADHLGTPQQSWQALAAALASGQPDSVKPLATAQGYQDLVYSLAAGMPDETRAHFQKVGEFFARATPDLQWSQPQADEAEAHWGPEIKVTIFKFIHTADGWKFNHWSRGR